MRPTSDEAAVRDLIEARTAAVRAKDADRVLACYALDVVRYDLAPPLATQGPEARDRANLVAWFDTWRGPIRYDLGEFRISMSDGLALACGLIRLGGTKTDGETPLLWARQTIGLARRDGRWTIVHEHTSTPFYMDGSLRAAVDLVP